MSILRFLGLAAGPQETPSADTETVRRIIEKLDDLEPAKARFIAAFAYVLSRVAHADLEVSKDEVRSMERIVMKIGGLPEEQAILVVQMAKTRALLFGSTENFLVTREFQELATPEQKMQLLECVFAVSAADDSISGAEESEIRKIADELKIGRRDYLQARLRYKDHLSVLRRPEDRG